MSKYRLINQSDENAKSWDDFIEESNEGTIFHKLEFLRYHGSRYNKNKNNLIWLKGNSIYGVFPMAVFEEEGNKIAISPYGASYGGPVFLKPLNYSSAKTFVESLINYLLENKIYDLKITFPIEPVHKIYSETLLFAFLEQGFRISNSDISSVVLLDKILNDNKFFTSRARNMAAKGKSSGINTKFHANLDDFWQLIDLTFDKHEAKPTHTKKEWAWLCERIKDSFWCDVAYLDQSPVAGIGHIKINNLVDSSFYLCSDPNYQKNQPLSFLIYESLIQSKKDGYKYFDFGTSSLSMIARDNIFRFKESYGAVGYFRHTLSWSALESD